jgi:UDP-N-acetylmuramoyl-tripeptide--D-alanyl-D-alanine ligase
MYTTLYIIGFALAWGYYTALKSRKSIHMLQQNSYRNERYFKWINEHSRRVFTTRELLPLLSIFLFIYGTKLNAVLAFISFYLLLSILKDKEVEKKPLTVTPRVKRLFVTTALLYATVFLISVYFTGFKKAEVPIVVAVLTLSSYLNYHIISLVNKINLPIEKRINQKYINDAARIVRSIPGLRVVGVTGSYGKTSVKHILHTVLTSKYHALMTPESYNTPLGVTITIRNMLKPIHEVFIAEMGAKQEGDIKEICDLVDQKYGIVTAVGPQHLETFKTIETIKKTKFEIIETLPPDGVGFVNCDDQNSMSYSIKNKVKIVYFGIDNEVADVRALNINYGADGATFDIVIKDGQSSQFTSKLLGKHNIYNILAAVAVGLEMGISLEKMASAVKKAKPVKHRLELKKRDGDVTIIDDSFNSNPTGSKMAIEVLGSMPGKKILVTPGMIELGEKEFELNKAFGEHAGKVCDYIILVGKKQTTPIQEGLKVVEFNDKNLYIAIDLNDAIAHLNQVVEKGSFVLFENDLPDTFNE